MRESEKGKGRPRRFRCGATAATPPSRRVAQLCSVSERGENFEGVEDTGGCSLYTNRR
ncbi:hypothetical protein HanIR_Chr07g0339021 [Helianthus annuus]|nr:hypothetical protein HanIR_Chr07g0339021 [Helianthus annuus]